MFGLDQREIKNILLDVKEMGKTEKGTKSIIQEFINPNDRICLENAASRAGQQFWITIPEIYSGSLTVYIVEFLKNHFNIQEEQMIVVTVSATSGGHTIFMRISQM